MTLFPAVDPIPLPAPIWLFKLLHIVTLSLHFVAVSMLLGGVLIALLLSAMRCPQARLAARALARRLPTVMTYVINLGVPPLLFAQVLYGRAIYTSSVLIGLYWIAVILLLMLLYRLLYRFTAQLEAGRLAWPSGLLAWLLAGAVAKIYVTNMTLMLRPEVWKSMYAASSGGALLPTGDPTVLPRWIAMLSGGLFVGGLWLLYLSGRKTFALEEKKYMAGLGGKIAALFGLVYLAAGVWASAVQPGSVHAWLAAGHPAHPFYKYLALAGALWALLVILLAALGVVAAFARLTAGWVGWTAALGALLVEICFVTYRDAVRDLTLLMKGYDVWDRAVAANWSVIAIFLALFVAGLGVIGWLISVVARAEKPMEGAAQ